MVTETWLEQVTQSTEVNHPCGLVVYSIGLKLFHPSLPLLVPLGVCAAVIIHTFRFADVCMDWNLHKDRMDFPSSWGFLCHQYQMIEGIQHGCLVYQCQLVERSHLLICLLVCWAWLAQLVEHETFNLSDS